MAKELEMTVEEIVRSYREAADKAHQLRVLADLNVCKPEVIRQVLLDGGVKPQKLPRQRKKKTSVAAVAAEVKAYEKERKAALVSEALRFLRANLQKEYEGLRAEWENISAEYLGKINAIDMMLEEDAG